MGPIRSLRKRRRVESKANKEEAMDNINNNHHSINYYDNSIINIESSDWWFEFSKRLSGPLSSFKGLNNFESVFKISRKTFDYLCSLVSHNLISKKSNFTFTNGKLLSLQDQVAIAIRRLGSGDSLYTIGTSFGINNSTVNQVTWRFVEAMEEKALHHLQFPKSEKEINDMKAKFEKIRGLPNCCGAIDTTHVTMCLPTTDSGSKVWLDYTKSYSMVLQAIVGPDMRFLDIVTGWPGTMDENFVVRSSSFFDLCEKGELLNKCKGEYIVGDGAFPLLSWLITPYRGKGISKVEEEFNRRHFATRVVAQRALARLKEMWRIIQGEMWRPDKHRLPRIILVCCLLHNIVIDLEDDWRDEMPLSHCHDANYKQKVCDSDDQGGIALRDEVCRRLCGKVSQ